MTNPTFLPFMCWVPFPSRPRHHTSHVPGTQVCDLESFVTAMAWSPTSGKDQSSSSETFATGGSDGVVRFVRCNGRVDKTLDAHRGAVTSTRWTNCGGFLLTSGEDGVVKTWSRSGNLHATLAVGDAAVYACAWSPRAAVFGGDGAVVFGRGNNLRIVSTADVGSKEQSAAKKNVPGNEVKAWKAHDGVVLSIDWCPALDGRIVSGGEDRRYKVWDGHGQILFISPARDHAITAVRWSPTGQHFAAGSFDSVWLCARDGWTNGSNDTGVGSAVSLAWARDGSSVAGCGGKPPFVFTGAVVDVEHLWDDIVVSRCGVTKLCEVTIHTFRNERSALDTVDDGVSTYTLKTGTERVSRLSWRHGILLVVSPKQICLHKSGAWQTPVATVDVSDCVVFIDQSRTGFAFVTATSDVVHVYTYDGQKVCDLRSDGLFPQSLDENVFSKSPDCVTFVDRSAGGDSMTCVDLSHSSSNGKQSGDGSGYKIPHSAKIQAVKLNQVGDASSGFRILAFLDSNKDLWLKRVEFAGTAAGGGHASSCVKIKSMVDCFAWSEKCDALVAVSRSQIVAWRCPVVFFTDNDLVGLTTTSKDLVGHGVGNAQTKGMLTITRFDGARVTVQNDDGARVTTSLCANSAFFPQLHNHAVGEKGTAKQWDKAIRLCRFAKDSTLWATLATHAMNVNELETAEIAYAALEQIEKVRISHLPHSDD